MVDFGLWVDGSTVTFLEPKQAQVPGSRCRAIPHLPATRPGQSHFQKEPFIVQSCLSRMSTFLHCCLKCPTLSKSPNHDSSHGQISDSECQSKMSLNDSWAKTPSLASFKMLTSDFMRCKVLDLGCSNSYHFFGYTVYPNQIQYTQLNSIFFLNPTQCTKHSTAFPHPAQSHATSAPPPDVFDGAAGLSIDVQALAEAVRLGKPRSPRCQEIPSFEVF